MIKRTLAAACAAGIALLVPTLANAQGAPANPPAAAAVTAEPGAGDRSAGREALATCRGDMAALCGTVERGGGRKIACLKENQSKLSPGCQAAIGAVLDKHSSGQRKRAGGGGKMGQACQADVATYCAGIEKGGGRIARCLKDNAGKLSPTCQGAFQERQASGALKKAAKAACAADRQSLCAGAEKGRAAVQCLREKIAQTSPGCQQAIASLPERPARVQR